MSRRKSPLKWFIQSFFFSLVHRSSTYPVRYMHSSLTVSSAIFSCHRFVIHFKSHSLTPYSTLHSQHSISRMRLQNFYLSFEWTQKCGGWCMKEAAKWTQPAVHYLMFASRQAIFWIKQNIYHHRRHHRKFEIFKMILLAVFIVWYKIL